MQMKRQEKEVTTKKQIVREVKNVYFSFIEHLLSLQYGVKKRCII
ncbi:hypothetical protein CULT_1680007 [[Clostridium] ultunense Esp]|nr:hypothetical protein CULT_1680007 [[Clostridium] ultunense Esp]